MSLEQIAIQRLTKERDLLRNAVRIAVVELYAQHPADVIKTFSVSELEDIVAQTERLRPSQVEDIYREALFPK